MATLAMARRSQHRPSVLPREKTCAEAVPLHNGGHTGVFIKQNARPEAFQRFTDDYESTGYFYGPNSLRDGRSITGCAQKPVSVRGVRERAGRLGEGRMSGGSTPSSAERVGGAGDVIDAGCEPMHVARDVDLLDDRDGDLPGPPAPRREGSNLWLNLGANTTQLGRGEVFSLLPEVRMLELQFDHPPRGMKKDYMARTCICERGHSAAELRAQGMWIWARGESSLKFATARTRTCTCERVNVDLESRLGFANAGHADSRFGGFASAGKRASGLALAREESSEPLIRDSRCPSIAFIWTCMCERGHLDLGFITFELAWDFETGRDARGFDVASTGIRLRRGFASAGIWMWICERGQYEENGDDARAYQHHRQGRSGRYAEGRDRVARSGSTVRADGMRRDRKRRSAEGWRMADGGDSGRREGGTTTRQERRRARARKDGKARGDGRGRMMRIGKKERREEVKRRGVNADRTE
ncbi:hypothetical protein DFH09DRAFT_1086512 [Mycena vulgaris]|nr:hypothetical protein DFH09DRAFT_1086512 [Mycena vulgaris]